MNQVSGIMSSAPLASWQAITQALNRFLRSISQGTAFLTFAIGIDGVSIEIVKYARVLESLYRPFGPAKLHFITGNFHPQADALLKPHWERFLIEGINGWSKWDEGQWFKALYYERLPAGSQRSSELAAEIYRQARVIAGKLADYLVAKDIGLLIAVNVASNPGNLALALALAFVSEALGLIVINSNHDFYWDGGKAAADRNPDEPPDERDHFFLNADNQHFFSLFKMLYPWQGRRWLQVNINNRQSERLIERHGFPRQEVMELSTCVIDALFDDYSDEEIKHARLRMATILSHRSDELRPRSITDFRRLLPKWMAHQTPQVIGARDSLSLDLTADDIIYLLQPTRVIARKRIEKGVELIQALLRGPMRDSIEQQAGQQLILHITGPTPLEHQADLETILDAYAELINSLPSTVAERIFLAFSGGRGTHAFFEELGFEDMTIADIFRMATAVLFPSEIEGRGLPIIESAAVGVPIICSRYRPEEVFAEVIGEDLPEAMQIRYVLFPEDNYPDDFLQEVAQLLTSPGVRTKWREHNRQAIRARYSEAALRDAFQRLLDRAYTNAVESK